MKKLLAVSGAVFFMGAGTAMAYPLPNDIASPVPPDSAQYYNLYVTKGTRPCPSTLTPNANADLLRGKADLLDGLAGVNDEAADVGEGLAGLAESAGGVAGAIGKTPWAKHPYVKAATIAVDKGCSVLERAARCAVEGEKNEANQMRAWAREARRQAKDWDAISKACDGQYSISSSD